MIENAVLVKLGNHKALRIDICDLAVELIHLLHRLCWCGFCSFSSCLIKSPSSSSRFCVSLSLIRMNAYITHLLGFCHWRILFCLPLCKSRASRLYRFTCLR